MQDLALPYFLTRGLWGAGTIFATFLLTVGIIKIRKWHRENIIKSKGMFNLAIFMLIVVVVVSINIFLVLAVDWSYNSRLLYFMASVFVGLVVFFSITKLLIDNKNINFDEYPVVNAKDHRQEVMDIISTKRLIDFAWWRIILPLTGALLAFIAGFIYFLASHHP